MHRNPPAKSTTACALACTLALAACFGHPPPRGETNAAGLREATGIREADGIREPEKPCIRITRSMAEIEKRMNQIDNRQLHDTGARDLTSAESAERTRLENRHEALRVERRTRCGW